MSDFVLEAKSISKIYQEGKLKASVLKNYDFSIKKGELVAIVGASGCGKSTLLQILGGLDTPTVGEVMLNSAPFSTVKENARALLRNKHVGFVYQFHHLLPEFTAIQNVAMPLLIRGVKVSQALEEAKTLLGKVGLEHRLNHKPSELSGGERQRTAIARALVTNPDIVLADEPTGNLDSIIAGDVFDLMLKLNKEQGTAFVLVTHDESLADKCGRKVNL